MCFRCSITDVSFLSFEKSTHVFFRSYLRYHHSSFFISFLFLWWICILPVCMLRFSVYVTISFFTIQFLFMICIILPVLAEPDRKHSYLISLSYVWKLLKLQVINYKFLAFCVLISGIWQVKMLNVNCFSPYNRSNKYKAILKQLFITHRAIAWSLWSHVE